MRPAANGGVELAYDIEGSGPDLLLVAGTASTRPLWSLVRPQLARSFRTIAFDNRDAGGRRRPRYVLGHRRSRRELIDAPYRAPPKPVLLSADTCRWSTRQTRSQNPSPPF